MQSFHKIPEILESSFQLSRWESIITNFALYTKLISLILVINYFCSLTIPNEINSKNTYLIKSFIYYVCLYMVYLNINIKFKKSNTTIINYNGLLVTQRVVIFLLFLKCYYYYLIYKVGLLNEIFFWFSTKNVIAS